jgi:hypothetical protein
LKTWEEAGAMLHGIEQADRAGAKAGVPVQNRPPGGATREGVPQPAAGNVLGGKPPARREPNGLRPVAEKPGDLDGSNDSPEPGFDGPEHYIVEDECGLLGHPLVRNGIPLWKAHAAAFDVGIDPGYRLHVSERLLVQKDGPMLEAIKVLGGGLLRPA